MHIYIYRYIVLSWNRRDNIFIIIRKKQLLLWSQLYTLYMDKQYHFQNVIPRSFHLFKVLLYYYSYIPLFISLYTKMLTLQATPWTAPNPFPCIVAHNLIIVARQLLVISNWRQPCYVLSPISAIAQPWIQQR